MRISGPHGRSRLCPATGRMDCRAAALDESIARSGRRPDSVLGRSSPRWRCNRPFPVAPCPAEFQRVEAPRRCPDPPLMRVVPVFAAGAPPSPGTSKRLQTGTVQMRVRPVRIARGWGADGISRRHSGQRPRAPDVESDSVDARPVAPRHARHGPSDMIRGCWAIGCGGGRRLLHPDGGREVWARGGFVP